MEINHNMGFIHEHPTLHAAWRHLAEAGRELEDLPWSVDTSGICIKAFILENKIIVWRFSILVKFEGREE